MANNYTVKVNKTIDLIITEDELTNLDVVKDISEKYHVLQNNQPFKAQIVKSNFNKKKYTVIVNNNTYDIEIKNELDFLIKQMGFTIGKSKKIDEIKAPMPGLILAISVEIGQEVKENDSILVLEAMKMENNITSPRDGVIKSIVVNKGDAVDKGTLLIEFE